MFSRSPLSPRNVSLTCSSHSCPSRAHIEVLGHSRRTSSTSQMLLPTATTTTTYYNNYYDYDYHCCYHYDDYPPFCTDTSHCNPNSHLSSVLLSCSTLRISVDHRDGNPQCDIISGHPPPLLSFLLLLHLSALCHALHFVPLRHFSVVSLCITPLSGSVLPLLNTLCAPFFGAAPLGVALCALLPRCCYCRLSSSCRSCLSCCCRSGGSHLLPS